MKLLDGKAKCRYCRAALSTSSGSTENIRRHFKGKHPTVPLGRVEPNCSQSPSSSGKSVDCSCLSAVANTVRYEDLEPTIRLFKCIRQWFSATNFHFDSFVNSVLHACTQIKPVIAIITYSIC